MNRGLWRNFKAGTQSIIVEGLKYLTVEEIIEYNKSVIQKIKVRKADSHKVIAEGALQSVIEECKKKDGDVYDVAVFLLKSLIQKHPFASGNRRTAWIATERFLELNAYKLNVDNSRKQAKVLQGLRENYYTDEEIREWLIMGKIRGFKR
jgi:death-on-curing family protein